MKVYCDGSAKPNPGRGTWAWITFDGEDYSSGGPQGVVSNNDMELQAILEALLMYEDHAGPVEILSDSEYALSAIAGDIRPATDHLNVVHQIRNISRMRAWSTTFTKIASKSNEAHNLIP